jgi:hypothetical protein
MAERPVLSHAERQWMSAQAVERWYNDLDEWWGDSPKDFKKKLAQFRNDQKASGAKSKPENISTTGRKKKTRQQGTFSYVPNSIYRDPTFSANAKALLVTIKSHHYKKPCTASQETLMNYMGWKRSTLYRALTELEDRKVIKQTKRGNQNSNIIEILPPYLYDRDERRK